jgi:hypothetical protein
MFNVLSRIRAGSVDAPQCRRRAARLLLAEDVVTEGSVLLERYPTTGGHPLRCRVSA